MAEREVPCYLPGSFTSSGTTHHQGTIMVLNGDVDSLAHWQDSKLLQKEQLS